MLATLPIPLKIIVFLFLFTFLFSVALGKSTVEIITLMKSNVLGRSLLVNFILLPVLGIILVKLFQLPSETSLGFLMIAVTPGGLLALHFARVSKGSLIYAVGLVILLSFLSIVLTPLLIYVLFPGFQATSIPILSLIGHLLILIIPPLFAGQVIQRWFPRITPKLQKLATALSVVLFMALTIYTSTLKALDPRSLGWNSWGAMATFVIMAWIMGWLFGGPHLVNRKVLAISTSMRNVAICLLIGSSSGFSQGSELAIIGFSELLVPMNLVFAIALRRLKTATLMP